MRDNPTILEFPPPSYFPSYFVLFSFLISSPFLSFFLAILNCISPFLFFLWYCQLHARLNSLSDRSEYPDINFYRSPRGSALCTSSFYFMTHFISTSIRCLRFLFLSIFNKKFLNATILYKYSIPYTAYSIYWNFS